METNLYQCCVPMRSICDNCRLYIICPLSRRGSASKCDAYLPCDAINNNKAGTEPKKPWIEDRTALICPHCGYVFSDEIRLMGQGKELPLNFCPVCGKEVDDSKR